MRRHQRPVAMLAAATLLLAACGDDEDTAAAEDTGSAEDASGEGPPAGGGGGGGGGGEVDPTAIATEDELVEMIGGDPVCGNGSLDLHRGHQPLQSTLEDVLGISHDEMHVYMEEQDMNLAAVAEEVGVGRDGLDEALVEHFSPAVDNLRSDGTISEDQAASYQEQLEAALDFRIDWDGEQAPLDFCTAST